MNMNEEWVKRGQKVIMKTYGQFPIALTKGEGAYVWDADGKKYLDFVAGIAVNCLGYNNKEWVQEISNQLGTIQGVSNLYWIPPQIELAELLVNNSGFDRAFFCNSGAEAIEAAIKLAKKYSFLKYGPDRNAIISMQQSFHGRTMATVTLTGQTKYQKGFNPLHPGVSYAEYNNIEDVKSHVNENTCAIIVEPIQGEGGIVPAKKEFLQGLRQLCDEKDIVLIYDEVQCGVGRTGELFAYQYFDVQPDIASMAKGLGGGLAIGAMVAVEKIAEAFEPGNHASTFGGNHIACTGGKVTVDKLVNGGLLDNVKKQGKYLYNKLKELENQFSIIKEARGVGLMQGIDIDGVEPKEIVSKSMEKGLLLIGAGQSVVRFVPPFIISEKEIDEAVAILKEVLTDVSTNK